MLLSFSPARNSKSVHVAGFECISFCIVLWIGARLLPSGYGNAGYGRYYGLGPSGWPLTVSWYVRSWFLRFWGWYFIRCIVDNIFCRRPSGTGGQGGPVFAAERDFASYLRKYMLQIPHVKCDFYRYKSPLLNHLFSDFMYFSLDFTYSGESVSRKVSMRKQIILCTL